MTDRERILLGMALSLLHANLEDYDINEILSQAGAPEATYEEVEILYKNLLGKDF
jgi:hypothetical protein